MTNDFLLAWICTCSVTFIAIVTLRPIVHLRRPQWIIVLATTVTYGVPMLVLPSPTGLWAGDVVSYHRAATAVIHRTDVYALTAFVYPHPYLPLQMYMFAAALRLADATPITFFTGIRMFHLAAAIAIALLIYRSSLRLRGNRSGAIVDSLAWAACPLPILISVYHGEIDIVSTALALGAWYAAAFGTPTLRTSLVAGVLLGTAIVDKTWPVILVPVLMYHLRGLDLKAAFLSASGTVIAVSVATYLLAFNASFSLLRQKTTGYESPRDLDGHTLVLAHLANRFSAAGDLLAWDHRHSTLVLAAAIAIVLIIVLPRRDMLGGVIATILAFYAFTATAGPNHVLWVVPFLLVDGRRYAALATIAFQTLIYVLGAFLYCGIACTELNAVTQRIFDQFWWLRAGQYAVVAVLLIAEVRRAFTAERAPKPRADATAEAA